MTIELLHQIHRYLMIACARPLPDENLHVLRKRRSERGRQDRVLRRAEAGGA
jgi:hypothetical protein